MKLVKWEEMRGRYAVQLGSEEKLNEVYIQFFIKRSSWQWGLDCLYYDGPHMMFGLGPLLFIFWEPWTKLGRRFAWWYCKRIGEI